RACPTPPDATTGRGDRLSAVDPRPCPAGALRPAAYARPPRPAERGAGAAAPSLVPAHLGWPVAVLQVDLVVDRYLRLPVEDLYDVGPGGQVDQVGRDVPAGGGDVVVGVLVQPRLPAALRVDAVRLGAVDPEADQVHRPVGCDLQVDGVDGPVARVVERVVGEAALPVGA